MKSGRVAYTSLWILGISTADGLPPILAGLLIDHLGMLGFMFALPPEEGKPPLHELHHLIQPSQPLRSLAGVFWITSGFGEK